MSQQNYMTHDDLVNNPTTRVPVCLVLDHSGSMQRHGAIESLNMGVRMFYDAIKEDEIARYSAEIAIVTFNSEITVLEDFSLVDDKKFFELKAEGGTRLGGAIKEALRLLEARKQMYKDTGVDYFQPMLIIMTDGKPGDPEDVVVAQHMTKELESNKKLVIFPITVGSDDNSMVVDEMNEVLSNFSNKRKALHLKDLKFNQFFEWLSKSIGQISKSQIGEKITLDVKGIEAWGDI